MWGLCLIVLLSCCLSRSLFSCLSLSLSLPLPPFLHVGTCCHGNNCLFFGPSCVGAVFVRPILGSNCCFIYAHTPTTNTSCLTLIVINTSTHSPCICTHTRAAQSHLHACTVDLIRLFSHTLSLLRWRPLLLLDPAGDYPEYHWLQDLSEEGERGVKREIVGDEQWLEKEVQPQEETHPLQWRSSPLRKCSKCQVFAFFISFFLMQSCWINLEVA